MGGPSWRASGAESATAGRPSASVFAAGPAAPAAACSMALLVAGTEVARAAVTAPAGMALSGAPTTVAAAGGTAVVANQLLEGQVAAAAGTAAGNKSVSNFCRLSCVSSARRPG